MKRKRICLALIIFLMLFCVGCRQNDPFSNYDIAFSELSSCEASEIISVQSELTHTPKAKVSDNVSLISFSDTIKRGNKAELVILGKPNTKYAIKVTYSSGISRSKALTPQVSDKNGYVAWIWTVGAKTKPGNYPVEISLNDTAVLKSTLNVTQ